MGPGFRQISVGSGPDPSLLISGPNFLPFIQSPFPGRKNYFKDLYFSFSLCLFLSPFLCLFYTHTHTHTQILSCFAPYLCGLRCFHYHGDNVDVFWSESHSSEESHQAPPGTVPTFRLLLLVYMISGAFAFISDMNQFLLCLLGVTNYSYLHHTYDWIWA